MSEGKCKNINFENFTQNVLLHLAKLNTICAIP